MNVLCYLRARDPAQTARVDVDRRVIFIVETVVFGLSVLPAFTFWSWSLEWVPNPWILRPAVVAMSLVPAYLVFAFALIACRRFDERSAAGARRRTARGNFATSSGRCSTGRAT